MAGGEAPEYLQEECTKRKGLGTSLPNQPYPWLKRGEGIHKGGGTVRTPGAEVRGK